MSVSPPPSGPRFAAEAAPVTFFGEKEGVLNNVFGLGRNGSVHCQNITYAGSSQTSESKSVTTVPSYSSCVWINYERTKEVLLPESAINFGGCSYAFEPGTVGQFAGSLKIEGVNCASSPITVSVPGCVYSIGPNTLSGVRYTNEGAGKVRSAWVTFGNETGKFSYSAAGVGCGESGSLAGGIMNNSVRFSATNYFGEQQGLWVVE